MVLYGCSSAAYGHCNSSLTSLVLSFIFSLIAEESCALEAAKMNEKQNDEK